MLKWWNIPSLILLSFHLDNLVEFGMSLGRQRKGAGRVVRAEVPIEEQEEVRWPFVETNSWALWCLAIYRVLLYTFLYFIFTTTLLLQTWELCLRDTQWLAHRWETSVWYVEVIEADLLGLGRNFLSSKALVLLCYIKAFRFIVTLVLNSGGQRIMGYHSPRGIGEDRGPPSANPTSVQSWPHHCCWQAFKHPLSLPGPCVKIVLHLFKGLFRISVPWEKLSLGFPFC